MSDISFMTNKEHKDLMETKFNLREYSSRFVKTFLDSEGYNYGPTESVFIVGESVTLTHKRKPMTTIDFCVLDRPHLTKLRKNIEMHKNFELLINQHSKMDIYREKDLLTRTPFRIFLCKKIKSRRELIDGFQYDNQKIHYDIASQLLYFTRQQYETLMRIPEFVETA